MNSEKKLFFLKNISFSHAENAIFSNIKLEIMQGSFTAVCGPSGAGKTTLLKILAGLLSPDQGEIFFNSRSIRDYTQEELARNRSFVSQHLPGNIEMSSREILETALYYSNLNEIEKSHKIKESASVTGIEHLLERRYSTLSGGEKRRVMLTRGFIQCNKVLLLDEPTVFLDIAQSRDMIELLKKFNTEHNSTVICVTHDLSVVARYFSHAILLAKGREIIFGNALNILEKNASSYFNVTLESGLSPEGKKYFLA
ncbi:ABC transporter ATP-binding protein [Myxococcota bacterium]|nr:ABC transporter ATP-binding protein [Myxococcota bacterium]MBU1496737.1 ABC transporter ATP-binding protein [Myxococcota bacterium]